MSETNEKKVESANEIETETTETIETTEEEAAPVSKEEELQAEVDTLKDKLIRHIAEFDNFKKRTAKDREDLYAIAVCDTIEKILPVKDNIERAVKASENSTEESLLEGVKMIMKQLDEVFSSIGVEPIAAVGCEFNPEKHNAVMHEENDEFGENTVSEELMRGYEYKEKRVIRHSMVKVAN